MSRKQLKFILGPSIIVLALTWIGYSALQQTGAYFQTVSELYAMADTLDADRLKVAGEVVPGTIEISGDKSNSSSVKATSPDRALRWHRPRSRHIQRLRGSSC